MITTHETRDDLVLSEGVWKDDTITMAAAGTLAKGTILGRQTSGGKLSYFNRDASDGTEEPVAILTHELVFSASGDKRDRVLVDGQVDQSGLVEYGEATALTQAIIDKIIKNTGVVPVPVRDLSVFDNE